MNYLKNGLNNLKRNKIMTYEEFMEQRNKLGNLYVVVRISDGKDLIRGCNYNKVIDLVNMVGKENIKIYFY